MGPGGSNPSPTAFYSRSSRRSDGSFLLYTTQHGLCTELGKISPQPSRR